MPKREPTENKKQKHIQFTPDEVKRLKELYPWLTDDDLMVKPHSKKGDKRKRKSTEAERGDDDDDSDREHVDISAELEAIEREFDHTDCKEYFYTRVLKGNWTEKHTGKPSNGIAGYCRGGLALKWCKKYSYAQSHAFHWGKFGQTGAWHLAREHCRRAHYFFTLSRLDDSSEFAYVQGHFDAYHELDEYRDFIASQPVDSEVRQRAEVLRQEFPVNPKLKV